MGAYDPWGVANLDTTGLIDMIFAGDHLTLLQTKYKSCGPHGFREEDFLSFSPHYKSIGANDRQSVASLDPRVLIGNFYLGTH